MFSDKIVYYLNSAAVGDLIASAPTLKWAIETYHSKTDYKVCVYPQFKELFPFVPEDKFIDNTNNNNFPSDYAIRTLNTPSAKIKNFCKLTPSRIKLTHYASIGLSSRILSDDLLKYIPLKTVDVSKYGIDFSKTVIIITTYRDKIRSIPADEILKISEYISAKGLIPVYVGKTGGIDNLWKSLAMSDFEYPGFGVDLRDKTSLSELASIMSLSKAVIGADSGPIHIAFTTNTPVICGFTGINPNLRIPYRGLIPTIPIVPTAICRFCESEWNLDFWDFGKCPRSLEKPECTTQMSSNKFINALEQLNVFKI